MVACECHDCRSVGLLLEFLVVRPFVHSDVVGFCLADFQFEVVVLFSDEFSEVAFAVLFKFKVRWKRKSFVQNFRIRDCGKIV